MKYFNCSTCSCCGDRPEENEFAINYNNNNINEQRLQNIKTKNSAIKIQRAYRAFKQQKNEEAKKKNNIKLSEKTRNEYIDMVSSLPEYMIDDINNNNKSIKENIEHKKANEQKEKNNNIDNDDYIIFGKKDFIDYYDFLKNNESEEYDNDYNKKNNKPKTTINNNIYSSLGRSNNSNNNNFGAPETRNKTKENKSINSHNNLGKIFGEYDIEKKKFSKQVDFNITNDINTDKSIKDLI